MPGLLGYEVVRYCLCAGRRALSLSLSLSPSVFPSVSHILHSLPLQFRFFFCRVSPLLSCFNVICILFLHASLPFFALSLSHLLFLWGVGSLHSPLIPFLCLSLSLSLYTSLPVSLSLSICLSVCLSLCLSLCLSVSLSLSLYPILTLLLLPETPPLPP